MRAGEIQASPKPEGLLTIGIGTSDFGPAGYSSLAYVVGKSLFMFRYWGADEFRLGVEGNFDEPALTFREYGLLYGRTFRKSILELSASVGIAYIDGIDRGRLIQYHEYERIQISTIGIPFEARFRFDLGFINLGGAWYGGIYNKKFSDGAMLEISLKLFGY
jgi:hypothetical protein